MPPEKRKAIFSKRQTGKGVNEALSAALKFIKDRKLISKGLSLIPTTTAQAASEFAGQIGFGRRRKTRK